MGAITTGSPLKKLGHSVNISTCGTSGAAILQEAKDVQSVGSKLVPVSTLGSSFHDIGTDTFLKPRFLEALCISVAQPCLWEHLPGLLAAGLACASAVSCPLREELSEGTGAACCPGSQSPACTWLCLSRWFFSLHSRPGMSNSLSPGASSALWLPSKG